MAIDHDHFRPEWPKVVNAIYIYQLGVTGRKTGFHFS